MQQEPDAPGRSGHLPLTEVMARQAWHPALLDTVQRLWEGGRAITRDDAIAELRVWSARGGVGSLNGGRCRGAINHLEGRPLLEGWPDIGEG